MRTRTAAILAAGMGIRLGPLGRERPKGFIRLGEAPIIEESLARLRKAGIERVVIGTGHLHHFYDALARRHEGLVTTVHNPRFAASGSLLTLYAMRDHLDEDFLLVESDLIFEQRALDAAQDAASDNLLVLSGPTRSGDEVFVETRHGCLVNMSKDRARLGPSVSGEMVGITRVSRRLYRAMVDVAAAQLPERPDLAYETDGLVAVADREPVRCALVPGLIWSEIDDADHLRRARESVYPALCRAEAPPAVAR